MLHNMSPHFPCADYSFKFRLSNVVCIPTQPTHLPWRHHHSITWREVQNIYVTVFKSHLPVTSSSWGPNFHSVSSAHAISSGQKTKFHDEDNLCGTLRKHNAYEDFPYRYFTDHELPTWSEEKHKPYTQKSKFQSANQTPRTQQEC
jgi:hypothetical protein